MVLAVMHAYIRCFAAAAAACWGLASPDFNTWSEPEAEDLGNQRYTSYKAFGIALGPKDGTKCH